MLARRGVPPSAGGALAGRRSLQADEHGSSRRVANVTNDPVAAGTTAVGQIMPADGFGLLGKPAGEIRGWCGHHGSRRRPAVAGGPEVACTFSLLRRDSVGLRRDRLIFARMLSFGH